MSLAGIWRNWKPPLTMLSTTKLIVMTNDVYTYQSSVERLLFVNVNSPPFLPMKLFSVIPDPLSRRVSLS